VTKNRQQGTVTLQTILKTKFEQVSHIYSIKRTSRLGEFAIGGFDGIYFGQISEGRIGVSTEQHLIGRCVKTLTEYAPDQFLVGIDNFPAYCFLDRVAKGDPVREVATDEVRTRCTHIAQIATMHPFYLARNSVSVDILNVATGQLVSLAPTEMTDRQYFDSACLIEDETIKIWFAEERKVDAFEAKEYASVTSFGALKYLEVSRQEIAALFN